MPATITCRLKHTIGKATFTTRTESKRDCNIFFHSTNGVVAPGIIQYIVSIPSAPTTTERIIFVTECYTQLPEERVFSLFSSHAPFGASLWSSKMSPVLEAVPADHVISHAIVHPWVKGAILCKIMNRVSICHYSHFRPCLIKLWRLPSLVFELHDPHNKYYFIQAFFLVIASPTGATPK